MSPITPAVLLEYAERLRLAPKLELSELLADLDDEDFAAIVGMLVEIGSYPVPAIPVPEKKLEVGVMRLTFGRGRIFVSPLGDKTSISEHW